MNDEYMGAFIRCLIFDILDAYEIIWRGKPMNTINTTTNINYNTTGGFFMTYYCVGNTTGGGRYGRRKDK